MTKKRAPKVIEYNPVCEPKNMHGYRGVRWVENASCGLRLVGFADKLAKDAGCWRRIDHKGWYTDDDGSSGEVLRGIVYALPGRHGKPLYVYGYDDPRNKDCALLCFDEPTDVLLDAAIAADQFAEVFAAAEREYNEAWQAGRRYTDLDEEIKDTRSTALKLGEEMRAAVKFYGRKPPTICAALREKFMELYRSIQKMRKERAELLERFGSQSGFADG